VRHRSKVSIDGKLGGGFRLFLLRMGDRRRNDIVIDFPTVGVEVTSESAQAFYSYPSIFLDRSGGGGAWPSRIPRGSPR
jgi:hypothetical protein